MEIDQEDHLYTSFFACTTKMLRSYVRTPFLRHARFGSFIPFEIFEVSRRNTHPRGLTTIHLSKSSKLRLKLDLRRFLGCPPHNVVRCGGADHRQLFVAVKPFVNHFFSSFVSLRRPKPCRLGTPRHIVQTRPFFKERPRFSAGPKPCGPVTTTSRRSRGQYWPVPQPESSRPTSLPISRYDTPTYEPAVCRDQRGR
jgi:hypothetical protein